MENLPFGWGGKLHNVMRRGGRGAVRPLVRPPGGVAKLALPVPGRLIVSIYAPAGGATFVFVPLGDVSRYVSIHAPAGGATRWTWPSCPCRRVSIHAPAGGATGQAWPSRTSRWFQFTLPRGERPEERREMTTLLAFQFTLPRGERPEMTYDVSVVSRFQFTLPRGERHGRQLHGELLGGVSIHAPAGGATVAPVRL